MCLFLRQIQTLKQDFKVILRETLEDSRQLCQTPYGEFSGFSLNSQT